MNRMSERGQILLTAEQLSRKEEALKNIIPQKPVSGVLVNAMLIGLQLAIQRTLGQGATAMTQLLVRNAEEFIRVLKAMGLLQNLSGNPLEDIPRVFRELEISERVEVEEHSEPPGYTVRVWDSVFMPASVYLGMNNVPFTINPEALLAAGIIAQAVKEKYGGKARMRVNVTLPKRPGEPLVINVRVIVR